MTDTEREKLTDLNKKILEIKKKIQLSDGQRKALFENCESMQKLNSEEIAKHKKEVKNLVTILYQNRSPIAKFISKNKRLETIIGVCCDKTCDEVIQLLDCQTIERTKKLDLLKYEFQNRKRYIIELGNQYYKLLSETEKKEFIKNFENPLKKTRSALENEIHAAEVQIREALHLISQYVRIRKCLGEYASKSASHVKVLEESLEVQATDIRKLQNLMKEANKRKTKAHVNLFKEEKLASEIADERGIKLAEGRRLAVDRKIELGKLENQLFQTPKVEDTPKKILPNETDEKKDKAEGKRLHSADLTTQSLEIFKKATATTSTQEALDRIQTQKLTDAKLQDLKTKLETDKQNLEKRLEKLKSTLESYKYTHSQESEKRVRELEQIQQKITLQKQKIENSSKVKLFKEETLCTILDRLDNLYKLINPNANLEANNEILFTDVKKLIRLFNRQQNKSITKKNDEKAIEESTIVKNLPALYMSLSDKLQQPEITTTSPSPLTAAGVEEEDEVPSRSYLKKQAQLVVDAKSRRKNVRIQLPKRS